MRKYNLKNNKIRNAGALMALAFLCFAGLACGREPVITTPSPIPSDGPTNTAEATKPAATDIPVSPTDTPTDTPTSTPTDTPTSTPTNTPTPISEEAMALLEQHDKKLLTDAYKSMYDTFTADSYGFPVISITTMDSEPVYKSASTVACVVDTFNCSEDFKLSVTAQIRVRGNSSAAPSKGSYTDAGREKYPNESYPYKIKFDSKQNLFGLNSGNSFKDWVLLETSTGRPLDNIYAFSLAQALHGGKYYASDGILVHVYLNGTYMGMYTLCEQSEVKKNRVNVKEADEGYTGTDIGYFMEIDNYANSKENPCFKITHHDNATVTDVQGMSGSFRSRYYTIHSTINSDEQTAFIKNYIANVFNILYEAVENDKYYTFDENYKLIDASDRFTNAKDCIGAVIDLESVVCSYLIEEITLDYDRGEGSFYMAVDFSEKSKYQKLTFLCPWDYEWGYFGTGSFPDKSYSLVAGAFDNLFSQKFGDRANYWFVLLVKEDWFRDMVRAKWAEFYGGGAYSNMVANLTAISESGAKDLKLANNYAKKNTAQNITSLGNYSNLVTLCDKRVQWLNEKWYGNGVTR